MGFRSHLRTRPPGEARFDFIAKLAFHRRQVLAAIEDEPARSLSTVFLDLSAGACNHDCTFCDGRFYPLAPASFSTGRLLELAAEIADLGADSVILVGEKSEPILHPGFARLCRKLIDLDLRVGLYTNGSVITDEILELMARLDFVRVSLDAGRAATYRRIHRPRPGGGTLDDHESEFGRILTFVRRSARAGPRELGASLTLIPDNAGEIFAAAGLVKSLGGDYLEVKPLYGPGYTFDPAAFSRLRPVLQDELDRCRALNDSTFEVILNRQLHDLLAGRVAPDRFLRVAVPRPCLTSRLRLVVNPRASFLCPAFRGCPDRSLGDARRSSLHEIWFGPRRRDLMRATCDRRCVYHGQNQALLQMRAGKLDVTPHEAGTTVQPGFL